MIPPSSTSSHCLIGRGTLPIPSRPLPHDGAVVSAAADRMYQIAALTAGLFLLATLI